MFYVRQVVGRLIIGNGNHTDCRVAAKRVLKFILSTSPSVLFLARVTNQGEGTNCVGGLQPKNLKLKQRSAAVAK